MPEPSQDRVNVIAPGGIAGSMSAEEFAERTKAGESFQLESDEARKQRKFNEQAGIGTALTAAGETAADTLSFGGYSAAGRALGGEQFAERSRMTRESSPTASKLGLAGALLLPALVSGGSSLAAEGVAGAAEAGAGAAGLAEAASGGSAVSRGLLGLGRIATAPLRGVMRAGEAAEALASGGEIAGHEIRGLLPSLGITGDSMLGAAARKGAKYAAGGAAEGAAFGAGNALSEEALAPGGDYSHLAEKIIAGAKDGALFGAALGGAAGATAGLGAKVVSKMAEHIGDLKLDKLAAESAVKAISPGAGAEVTPFGKRLLQDDIVRGGRSYDDMLARAQTVKSAANDTISNTVAALDDAGRMVSTPPLWSKLSKEVLEPLARRDARAANILGEQLQPLSGEGVGFQQLHELAGTLDSSRVWGSAVPPKALKEGIAKAQHLVTQHMDESVAAGLKSLSKDEIHAIGMRRGLATEATSEEAAAHANAFAAGMDGGGALRAFTDAQESARASGWAERQLLKRAESDGAAGGMLQLTDKLRGAAGLAAGLMSHGLAGGAALGTATSAASSYLRKNGRSIIADLAYRASQADTAIVEKVHEFVHGTAKGGYTAGEQILHHKLAEAAGAFAVDTDHALGRHGSETRAAAFERTAQAVRNGVGSQPMVVDTEAPRTGDAMKAVIQRGMSFLQTKLPPGQGAPNPLYKPPPPGAESVATFAKYVKAVKDPFSVFDSMSNGTVSPQEIEALKAVYPSMYETVQKSIAEELVKKRDSESIPHARKVNLGVMFGIDSDPSLETGSYQVIQASYSVTEQGPQGKTTTTVSARGPSALGKMSKALATGAEKLEGQELEI